MTQISRSSATHSTVKRFPPVRKAELNLHKLEISMGKRKSRFSATISFPPLTDDLIDEFGWSSLILLLVNSLQRMNRTYFHDGSTEKQKGGGNEDVIRQSLQILERWEPRLCHPRLSLSSNQHSIHRKEHFEFFPVAVASCISWSCLGVFRLSWECSLIDWSLGVISLSNYRYDHNLADCIGKIPHSWSLIQTSHSSLEVWSCGSKMASLPNHLRSKDVIAVYLDQNNQTSPLGGNIHFYINESLVFTMEEVPIHDVSYAMACTLSPNSSVTILRDKDIVRSIQRNIEQKNLLNGADGKEFGVEHPEQCATASSSIRVMANPSMQRAEHRLEGNEDHKGSSESIESRITSVTSAESAATRTDAIPVPSFFPSQQKSLLANPKVMNAATTSTTNSEINMNTSSSTNSMECCICMSSTRSVLFMPCKHLCCCEPCGLAERLTLCPMCRLRIKSRMKIFM